MQSRGMGNTTVALIQVRPVKTGREASGAAKTAVCGVYLFVLVFIVVMLCKGSRLRREEVKRAAPARRREVERGRRARAAVLDETIDPWRPLEDQDR